jgi:hypothetical protein
VKFVTHPLVLRFKNSVVCKLFISNIKFMTDIITCNKHLEEGIN